MINKQLVSQRIERFKMLMIEKGYKLTQQRLEIYKALAAREDHPSAEEIHKRLRKRLPTLSLDTVYRTLWTFRDLGIIATLNPHQGVARFDANHSHHHHFVCERCGAVQDYDNHEFNAIPLPADLGNMGEAKSLHVEIRGLCRKCLADKDEINSPTDQDKEQGNG